MKSTLLTLLLMIPLCAAAIDYDPVNDWAWQARYAAENDSVRSLPASERRVVFLGNSITECWVQRHPDFFADNGFVGRGISGQTTAHFLGRFASDVLSLQPQVLVLNGGTNDVAENNGPYCELDTFDRLAAMATMAREAGIKVVMTSVLPAVSFPWRPEVEDVAAKIASLNNRLQVFAQERGIPYVDYFSALVSADGCSMPEAYAFDGVHPTPEGYDIMESLLLTVLTPLLTE